MSTNDTRYGLPTPRDKDGQLQPVDHEYYWQGQDITIRVIPPTIAELDEYEGLGADVTFGDLYAVVDKHLVKPELPGEESTTGQELTCYLHGIMNVGGEGTTAFAEEVQDRLDARGSDAGN